MSARRAVVRWAVRLFRREWRQQILVLALLTVSVTAAIFGASAVYNTAGVSGDAEFGKANDFLRFDAPDPQTVRANVAAAEAWFGTIDVITHWYVRVPGSVELIEFRAQDPEGAFGAPMLALREGRYPNSAGEVAVTDAVAETFDLGIGVPFGLDGRERVVVGLVENPSDLNAEFALVTATNADAPESVTILAEASPDQIEAFLASDGVTADGMEIGQRPGNEDVWAAASVLGVATVAMLLVALIAAGSFVVMAQRRLRQLGMLAAIGATEQQLRLVMVANGTAIGVVAAAIGAAVGVASWIAAAPGMESAVGYRIDPLNVPWWLVGTAVLLGVATATGAAWWPARAVARVPITAALSGRPPRPKAAPGSAVVAGLFIAVGVICLSLAGDATVSSARTLLFIPGTVATVLGVLLIGPLAIRALAATASWLPVAVRLALRDLARYQARAAFALAAISLALGIPVAIVVTAAAAERTAAEGNLSNNQLLIRMGDPNDPDSPCPGPVQTGQGSAWWEDSSGPCPFIPEWTPADLERQEADVARIVALLDEPKVAALDVALDPGLAAEPGGREAVTLAGEAGDIGLLDVSLLYLATPELLAHYGLDLGAVGSRTDVLTVETEELWLVGFVDPGTGQHRPEVVTNVERLTRGYTSLPGSFITAEALRQRGWETARVGWLVESGSSLTDEQIAAARELAADAGFLIETRDQQESLAALRSRATAAGMLLALGVLAMTVGLIRSEAGRELRTLTATGATSTIRRTLTAATAGALAFLGVTLGTAGAYLVLAAGYLSDIGSLRSVPVLHLLVIAVGVPLVAAFAGWLLSGREPASLVRQPIE